MLATLVCGAAACSVRSVESDPQPLVELPEAFPSLPPEAASSSAKAVWWAEFDDAQLDALIRQALARAFDVDVALERVEQARARARQLGAPLRPSVDALASHGVENTDANAFRDLDDDTDTVTQVGLVASWELDLFGRLSARRAAALEDVAVSEADLAGVRLALSADMADAYLAALEQHLQLALLDGQLALDLVLLELTEFRFAQGAASAVDVLQQQGQVAATRARFPPARAARRVAENRIDVLLGTAPDGIDRVSGEAFRTLPELPPVGVPSELLLRRPDLRARLRDVVGRDQLVSAALAGRFPRIALTGSLGWRSADAGDGFAASLGANLLAPLTDGGFRRAVVAENESALREAVAALSNTFLLAMEEVDSALWLEQQQREELRVLVQREEVLESNVVEARNRYANGLTDYLPVFVAVDDVQQTQRDVLQRRRALLSRRVSLHRALGGALPPLEASDAAARDDARTQASSNSLRTEVAE
ncbi:MAG: outer membrane efflux protein [Planctomycetota bacterium]|nr:MAG: outer membrane efflux protein [Planctomycetota bacterium]